MSNKTVRKRVRDARKEIYRQAILEAAESVFGEQGYDACKVNDIASRAGVSLATLYAVFGGKFALYAAVHETRLLELMEHTLAALGGAEDDLLARIRSGFSSYLLYHMERPDYLRMQLRDGNAWSLNDELRTDAQTQAWTNGLAMLVETFKAATDAGLLLDEDPELIARTAVGMHQVRLALWLEREMSASPDRVVEDADRMFIRTFGTSSLREREQI